MREDDREDDDALPDEPDDDTPDTPHAPTPSSPMRRRIALLVTAAAAAAVYFTLAPHWPKDQVVHVVLGESAATLTEVRVRYAEARGGEDWTREADFRYPQGGAPRVLTHEPRLPDGDYVVEIDLVTAQKHETVRRRIALQGGSTSIDVSAAVAR